MSIRTVIAEDEPLARNKLAALLTEEPDIQLVAACGNVPLTIEAVLQHKPSLLMLDVEMPGGNGFDVLEAVSGVVSPAVIFTTAFDNYAVKAFEAQALDYLLKPFDKERLQKALNRARMVIKNGGVPTQSERIQTVMRDPRVNPPNPERFIIKSGGRVLFLNVNEIDWIEAAANYVKIHAGKDVHLLRETMNSIEKRLDQKRFIRIHRSIIANQTKMRELRTCNSGEFIVTMKDGKELAGSRSYRPAVQPFLRKAAEQNT
jgi:two-component system, LytTR family, response regulator